LTSQGVFTQLSQGSYRSDYLRLKNARSYFGNFDPFGDFDLIFGASRLGLKIIEVPIRYVSRTYGKTQISRFHHGLLLLRMVCLRFCASKRLKLDAIIHPPERILESSHQPCRGQA
jgi:hypothetical protein